MADEQLYALTAGDVKTLRDLISAWRRGDLGRPQQLGRTPLGERSNIIFGVADAPIAGTSAALSDPPSGTLSVYKFTSTNGTTDSNRDETVYNLDTVTRTTDQFTVCVRDHASGKWLTAGSGGSATTYKRVCDFVLDAVLSTTDVSGTAKITAQYGDGTAHTTTGTITVNCGPIDFFGTSGTSGVAYWDSGTNWRILNMTRSCTT